MTVSFVSAGAGAGSSGGLAAGAPIPAGSVGDILIFIMGWGNPTDTPPATTPAGYTLIGHKVGGTGTFGLNVGHRGISACWRIADGSEGANTPAWTTSGSGSCGWGYVVRWARSGSAWVTPTMVSGSDDNTTGNYSAAMASDPGTDVGDVIVPAIACPETPTPTLALTYAGVTVTLTTRGSGSTGGGNQVRTVVRSGPVTGGPSSGIPTITAASQVSGPGILIRLRDTANAAPTADAGSDQTVEPWDTVTLNGTASSDPDGNTPLTYAWTQTGGPAVTLSSSTVASPTFEAPAVDGGTAVTFSLMVTDSLGQAAAAPDTVTINVNSAQYFGAGAGVWVPRRVTTL